MARGATEKDVMIIPSSESWLSHYSGFCSTFSIKNRPWILAVTVRLVLVPWVGTSALLCLQRSSRTLLQRGRSHI
ncbi:hypothetical protein Y1Q_0009693 [Alligator mississippiensis]|uniref:Uncharacterized protein n=1 Tax=Alligator mississippiensis TaxID=8496 RepID=A0A151MWF3_ALLMI|nr:hypothetical protein Y1Q_0009693 [Alligator mississippiensis]